MKGWHGDKHRHMMASKGIKSRGHFLDSKKIDSPVYIIKQNTILYIDDEDFNKIYELLENETVIIDYKSVNGVLSFDKTGGMYDELVMAFPSYRQEDVEERIIKPLQQNLDDISSRRFEDGLERRYYFTETGDGIPVIRINYKASFGEKLNQDDLKIAISTIEHIATMENIEVRNLMKTLMVVDL